MKTILIVDDHQGTTDAIQKIVQERHNKPLVAHTAEQAFNVFKSASVDLVITDVKLPGKSGLDLLKQVREIDADIPVIVITAFGSIQNAVEAMKLGAFDYISKPFTVEEIEVKISKALKSLTLGAHRPGSKVVNLHHTDELKSTYPEIIGQSKKMQNVFTVIDKAAAANSPVLILGESGTGKELVARALHYHSPRASQPFV
ncbi:MAG: sigma-54-dependent Fis family transcriptional regulator, partial [Calditrichaeota bacterium]